MPILLMRSGGRDGKGMTGGETMLSLHNLMKGGGWQARRKGE